MAPRQRTMAAAAPAPAYTAASGRQHSATAMTAAPPAATTKGSSVATARAQQAKYSQMDFNSLNIHVLRKYRQVFKLNIKARSSKDELVVAATRHFSGHLVDEVDTIARFLYTVHSNKEGKRPLSII